MAAAAPPPPPLRGVSLAGLHALAADAGGRAALAGWTTGRLKADFVLGATTTGVAYADVLAARRDGAALVGPATVFLSHAYAYEFLDALDAAGAWEARWREGGGAASFFYFDLAVVECVYCAPRCAHPLQLQLQPLQTPKPQPNCALHDP